MHSFGGGRSHTAGSDALGWVVRQQSLQKAVARLRQAADLLPQAAVGIAERQHTNMQ